ncbi:hypothetical protein HPB50_020378 [Hyalomma asiaticum]|uniref:Uncharacterized protein n=1 Tax=Hyalomma asiaticum TaxID=266040 RepID=A0ACB7SVH3_HYAAI|nr:hypothetical protein HPB50_020378 [Hyalomma asiaticum]
MARTYIKRIAGGWKPIKECLAERGAAPLPGEPGPGARPRSRSSHRKRGSRKRNRVRARAQSDSHGRRQTHSKGGDTTDRRRAGGGARALRQLHAER